MPEDTTIWLKNEGVPFVVRGENRAQASTTLKLEDDGSVRAYCLQIYQDAAGQERYALVEADRSIRNQMVLWETTTPGPIRWRGEPTLGEACVSLYGTDTGGAIRGIENETSGELRVVGMGADEANNLDRLRTDPDRIQWTRPYDGYQQVDPVLVPNAEGILWNPGATAAELYEVSFLVVNIDGAAAVVVSVGVDIAAGGGLAAEEYWMYNETIAAPGTSGWRGPFLMAGDDDIRGVAGAANDAAIHFRIRRVDTGA